MGLRLFLASLSQQDFIIDHRTIHIHITTKLTIKNSFTKINELTFCLHSSVTLVFDLLIYILLRLKWNNFDGRLRCPIDICVVTNVTQPDICDPLARLIYLSTSISAIAFCPNLIQFAIYMCCWWYRTTVQWILWFQVQEILNKIKDRLCLQYWFLIYLMPGSEMTV